MNASPNFIIWWKEVRGILPMWIGLLATMWLPGILDIHPLGMSLHNWSAVTFAGGSAMIAAMIWAGEFQDRTMIWQLLQPVHRLSILGRKAMLFAGVLGTTTASVMALNNSFSPITTEVVVVTCQLLAIALTSVAFWGILLRNTLATAVMCVAFPMLLALLLNPLFDWLTFKLVNPADPSSARRAELIVTSGAALLYSLVTGIGALLLWRRLELRGDALAVSRFDIGWMKSLAGDTSFKTRPTAVVLWRKELGLLRFVFWSTAAAAVIAIIYFAAAHILDHLANGQLLARTVSPTALDRELSKWWENLNLFGSLTLGFYLAFTPTLSGALAFAEESYFGTRLWQLSLPATLTRQREIKMIAARLTSILTGLLLPALVAFPLIKMSGGTIESEIISQTVCIHFLLFALTAWSGTWSRTSVAALLKAFLIVAGFMMLYAGVNELFPFQRLNWQYMAWPTVLLAIALTYSNFSALDFPARRWGMQLAALAALASAGGILSAMNLR